MSASPASEALFDPEFLAAVSRWTLGARRVAPAGRHGARLSPDLGNGIEFKDHRPYSPGDDLRAIDWNSYRRLGKLFVRQFEQEENFPLYLLPDISRSMYLGEGFTPAISTCLRCTFALGAIGLSHGDAVGLFPFGEQIEVLFKAKSGQAQTMNLAHHLIRLATREPGSSTQLPAALHRLGHLNLRKGLVVIISDFFDEAGLAALKSAVRSLRHKTLLVQVYREADAEPRIEGELRLTDCESGASTDLSVTPELLQGYREAYRKFNQELSAIASELGSRLLRVDIDKPLVPQLAELLKTGELHT